MKRVYISKIIQDNWRTELTCHSLQNFSIKHTHALSYGKHAHNFSVHQETVHDDFNRRFVPLVVEGLESLSKRPHQWSLRGLFFLGGAVGAAMVSIVWVSGGWSIICATGAGFAIAALVVDAS